MRCLQQQEGSKGRSLGTVGKKSIEASGVRRHQFLQGWLAFFASGAGPLAQHAQPQENPSHGGDAKPLFDHGGDATVPQNLPAGKFSANTGFHHRKETFA
jgi:hypothetical protein